LGPRVPRVSILASGTILQSLKFYRDSDQQ
jgi:hypothetical protein